MMVGWEMLWWVLILVNGGCFQATGGGGCKGCWWFWFKFWLKRERRGSMLNGDIVIRLLASKLDLSSSNVFLRGISQCSINKGIQPDPVELQKLQAVEMHLSKCISVWRIGDWKVVLKEDDAAVSQELTLLLSYMPVEQRHC